MYVTLGLVCHIRSRCHNDLVAQFPAGYELECILRLFIQCSVVVAILCMIKGLLLLLFLASHSGFAEK